MHCGDWRFPAIRFLCKALTSDQVAVRLSAVQILAQIGDTRVVLPLCSLLNDPDAGVRQSAAKALVKSAISLEPLCAALHDKDALVREAAAERSNASACRKILPCRSGFSPPAHLNGNALSVLAPSRWTPSCSPVTHSRVTMRSDAVRTLGEIGDARALQPLLQCLNDPEREVPGCGGLARWYACMTRAC